MFHVRRGWEMQSPSGRCSGTGSCSSSVLGLVPVHPLDFVLRLVPVLPLDLVLGLVPES